MGEALKAALKSLRLGLTQSFMLKNQCNTIVATLKLIEEDVKKNEQSYEGGVFAFKLTSFLKKFLRYVRIHLRVTDRFPVGLGDLRKARSLCNVNSLRLELNGFSSEFQVLLFCSPVFGRLSAKLGQLYSGDVLARAYHDDNEMIGSTFTDVFEALREAFPQEKKYSAFLDDVIYALPSPAMSESFDAPRFKELSYHLEQELLDLTANTKTPYEALEMKKDTPFLQGRFGKIYQGTLGGPMSVCIQEVSKKQLQTLSSSGRIKLFQTLRTNRAKPHDTLIEVLGVTLHEGVLYVAMEKFTVSLKQLLHGGGGVSIRAFSQNELLCVFQAVSSALDFIHAEGIVHGDVRPENVFFSRKAQNGHVKLAMFSYELNLDELQWSTWSEEGLVYQAPEVLGDKQFTSASDIYSLGLCLWESCQNNRTPFDDVYEKETDIISEIKSGRRPGFMGAASEPQWLIRQAEKCWHKDAATRPNAASLKQEYIELAKNLGATLEQMSEFVSPMVKAIEKSAKGGNDRDSASENAAPAPVPKNIPRPIDPPSASKRPLPQFDEPAPPRRIPDVPPSPARRIPDVPSNNLPPPPSPDEAMFHDAPPPPPRGGDGGEDRPLPPFSTRKLPAVPDKAPAPSPRRAIPPVPGADNPPGLPRRQPEMNHDTINKMEEQNNYDDDSDDGNGNGVTVGVNGLTESQVREELVKFYQANDPAMLQELGELISWCMYNGLEEFDKLLVEKFGRGLDMFNDAADAPPPIPQRDQGGGRGGLASIFGRGGQGGGGRGQDYGLDPNAPPPFPARQKPPGL